MTREQFITEYEKQLKAEPGYAWTQDAARLEKFITSVRKTLFTNANTWNIDSPVARATWRAIGCKGAMTYKALRALPEA